MKNRNSDSTDRPVPAEFSGLGRALASLKDSRVELPPFQEGWLSQKPKYILDRNTMETIQKKGSKMKLLAGAAAALVMIGLAGVLVIRTGTEKRTELKAVVLYVNGNATLQKPGKAEKKLFTGDVIHSKDTITTAEKSIVEISLMDKTAVRLEEKTAVVLTDLYQTEKGKNAVKMNLKKGTTFNVVNKLSPDDDYTIHTPTAIASVRGTQFEVSFNPEEQKTTLVHLSNGAVEVTDLTDQETELLTVDHSRVISESKDDTYLDKGRSAENNAVYSSLKNHIAGIDDEVMKSIKSIKEIKTEKELVETYKQSVEIYTLQDGRELRGVVVSQSNGKMVMHSLEGVFIIDENDVLGARFVEEEVTEPVNDQAADPAETPAAAQ